ncbi:alpha- and gamma-adaptin-binding protein p34-like isoform X2 [Eurytemora carolleeae]|uniref:alpha- and gamma-adaptin-binding protein p34-like isoform X2 n=1 Tax=Eurytemora carolleeae TaxID=1294199 RepID=UPI000C758A2C|nr:alpha- and gamma-adaptin-binding protein p34-like isoform X2 [Eurytemora carolleeae]|eukprot:XP_023321423.1 alpha- and gamma-adaptin-binding protein p34-like isoform X2 [Eurytemora affinis]
MNTIPHCSLINLTSAPSSWILDLILHPEQSPEQQNTIPFKIQTKYFNADIHLNHFHYSEHWETEDSEKFNRTEALLLYCEGTKESFAKAEKVWEKMKEFSPPVCLCIIDSTREEVEQEHEISRTGILSWCLNNQFELIECDEEIDECGEIEDKVGKDRILEALKSHTWSNMELIENSKSGAEDEKPKPNLEANMDSFESLFAQLASMKEKSSNLSPADRKLYAEQVAMSFYAAMGSSDDEFDDVNDV